MFERCNIKMGRNLNMMTDWNWGHGMMGGFGLLGLIFWLVILVDLILFGIWLIKQIQKK